MDTRQTEQNPNPLESLTQGPLARRVKGTAFNIARRYAANREDVEQDLLLLLLERYADDPNSPDDPVEAVNWAANRVGWQHRKELIHTGQIGVEDRPITDDPNAPTLIEMAGEGPWDDVELGLVVSVALEQLDERNQQIAHGLAAGYSPREMAPMVGRSFRMIYSYINGPIAEALRPLAFGERALADQFLSA